MTSRNAISGFAFIATLATILGCGPDPVSTEAPSTSTLVLARPDAEPVPTRKGATIPMAERLSDGERLKKVIGEDPVALEIPSLAGIAPAEQAKMLKWFLRLRDDKLVDLVTETRRRRDIAPNERAAVARDRIGGLISALEAKGVRAADLPANFKAFGVRDE